MAVKILCVNAAGAGDLHEARAHRLAAFLEAGLGASVTHFNVERESRRQSSRKLQQLIESARWDLIYQESTGIAGGWPLIHAAKTRRQKFIVSSGDPIRGFFQVTKGAAFGRAFGVYETMLMRSCAGFIGWTPYLTGRALELGAPRAITVEGAADANIFHPFSPEEKRAAQQKYGLDPNHLICGVVGSLKWTARQTYCYGLELVESLAFLKRRDVSVFIVGDGDGRAHLEARVPREWKDRVVFTGRLAPEAVPEAMNAMSIGFITQTLDSLGNFRLTTKLPEYLACGLPVAMSPVPGFYDYALPAGWPLPALHPSSAGFHQRLAQWLDALTHEDVQAKASWARAIACQRFDYQLVGTRFCAFVESLLR